MELIYKKSDKYAFQIDGFSLYIYNEKGLEKLDNNLNVLWKCSKVGKKIMINNVDYFEDSDSIFTIDEKGNYSILFDNQIFICNSENYYIYNDLNNYPSINISNLQNNVLINKHVISHYNLLNEHQEFIHFFYQTFNKDYHIESTISAIEIYKNDMAKLNLWTYQFNFPKYYHEGYCDYRETQLEKFIGVYDNELWVLFSANRILVLDINTGKELHQFEALNKTLETPFFINNCFLDATNGTIKILAYLYYIEIEIETKKASIKKHFKDFSMVNGSYYGGDTIYFVGNNHKSQSISNNIAGIFNTKTLEIEWSYELEVKDKNHFFIDVPQANDNYFGVKDSENTLYLFER